MEIPKNTSFGENSIHYNFHMSIYEKLLHNDSSGNKIIENYLTPDELIAQSYLFIQRYITIPHGSRPDTIFFPDKAGRKCARVFMNLHREYLPEISLPQIRFISIGRTGTYLETSATDPISIRAAYEMHINSDGKIMILDDYEDTGGTLEKARRVISQAFPQAKVEDMSSYGPTPTMFSKIPAWSGIKDAKPFIGIEEYTQYDEWDRVITEINRDLGTSYNAVANLVGKSHHGELDMHRFGRYLRERKHLKNPPYVKPLRGNLDHVLGLNSELDMMCGEVARLHPAKI